VPQSAYTIFVKEVVASAAARHTEWVMKEPLDLVVIFFKVAISLECAEPTETITKIMVGAIDDRLDFIQDRFIPLLSQIWEWIGKNMQTASQMPWFMSLHQHCAESLTTKMKELNATWSMRILRVHKFCSCDDCAKFVFFCNDADRTQYQYAAREDKRKHLQKQITLFKIPVTVTTSPSGHPRSLICEKQGVSSDSNLQLSLERLEKSKKALDFIFELQSSSISAESEGPHKRRKTLFTI